MKRAIGLVVGVVLVVTGCASAMSGQAKPTAPPPATGAAAVTAAGSKKRMTRIVVYKDGNDCKATIDEPKIYGKKNKRVLWMVQADTDNCYGKNDWHIELRFETAWNHGKNRVVNINPDDFEKVAVHPQTTDATYTYKVWLVVPTGWFSSDEYELIDPELEIGN